MKKILVAVLAVSTFVSSNISADAPDVGQILTTVGSTIGTIAGGPLGKGLSEQNRKRVQLLSNAMEQLGGVTASVQLFVKNLKKIQEEAIKIQRIAECMAKTGTAACTALGCKNTNACIDALLIQSVKFLQLVLADLLGDAEKKIAADGTESYVIKHGALGKLATMKVVAQTKQGAEIAKRVNSAITNSFEIRQLLDSLGALLNISGRLEDAMASAAQKDTAKKEQEKAKEEPVIVEIDASDLEGLLDGLGDSNALLEA